MDKPSYSATVMGMLTPLFQRFSGSGEQRILLGAIVDVLPKAMQADRCSIFIHDPGHDRAWLQCGTGLAEKELDIPLRGSISGEVMVTGRSVMVPDMRVRPGVHTDIDAMTGYDTRSVLCAPITDSSGRKVRGTIQLINKLDGKAFTRADQEVLEQVTVGLRKAVRTVYVAQFSGSTRLGRRTFSRNGSLLDTLRRRLAALFSR